MIDKHLGKLLIAYWIIVVVVASLYYSYAEFASAYKSIINIVGVVAIVFGIYWTLKLIGVAFGELDGRINKLEKHAGIKDDKE